MSSWSRPDSDCHVGTALKDLAVTAIDLDDNRDFVTGRHAGRDNGIDWGMHLTPEAPRSSIRALEDYSRTLGSFKSASPSGFKVNRCRPPAGRNERRL